MEQTPRRAQAPAHVEDAETVLTRLQVDPAQGLSAAEAAERLRAWGPNRLREARKKSWWRVLLDQFTSPVVVLLLIAALVAAVFAQFVEAVAIAAALVINAAIGFVTEWRARESMEALRRLGQMTAAVRRGGRVLEVPADELVPGDIVLLEEGEMVPADLRLIEVENLQCNEAALTGESVPVAKHDAPLEDADAPLSERVNLAFSGTAVTRGRGEGVAVGTGMQTEIGRISALVEEAGEAQTPLERRLERLAKRLIYLVIVVGIAVAAAGITAGKDLFLMIETAIVLAIAAVPEGLPIVATVALGRGMWRMARRHALVKHLSAVETLGATTVIFSDKTGTLTENRMVLRRVALPGGEVELVREGGRVAFRDGDGAAAGEREDLRAALRVGVLCTNATLTDTGVQGDPTEVALLEGGLAAGFDRPRLLEALPEVREESFDTDTKKMATYHAEEDGILVLVKGAPEAVLAACTAERGADGAAVALDEAGRRRWQARNEALAADGLRVLAVAEKRVADAEAPPYGDLVLLGLAGIYDPPRESVREAIARCRAAGIQVRMVTGDQPATAANIARAVGIADAAEPVVLTGRELARRKDGAADEAIRHALVFARVAPEQKLRLVEAFQERGEVVAMTGDGVNDAPALKKADIGIAMGKRGTEVARETADIVLADDAFESIVVAVEQGRTIFDNIRKFVVYLLSGNLGQILGVSAAALANAPLPLLPLQILFLNLLLDVFPALALGVGPGSPTVMDRPPRDPREPILTTGHWWAVAGFGLLMAAALLGVFAYALIVLELDRDHAVTMAFLTYGFARLWHSFNMRAPETGLLRNDITGNPWVWAAIGLCAVLLIGAVYLPGLAALLQVVPLAADQWAVVLGASLLPLVLGQGGLLVLGARHGCR